MKTTTVTRASAVRPVSLIGGRPTLESCAHVPALRATCQVARAFRQPGTPAKWTNFQLTRLHVTANEDGARYHPLPVDANLQRLDQDLAEAVRLLAAAYEPERVYLFGSMARGDAGADSDYDLMVVVPDDASEERRGRRLAYEALRGTGIPADVIVCTRRYFDARLHLHASLPATIVREGKLVHAA